MSNNHAETKTLVSVNGQKVLQSYLIDQQRFEV